MSLWICNSILVVQYPFVRLNSWTTFNNVELKAADKRLVTYSSNEVPVFKVKVVYNEKWLKLPLMVVKVMKSNQPMLLGGMFYPVKGWSPKKVNWLLLKRHLHLVIRMNLEYIWVWSTTTVSLILICRHDLDLFMICYTRMFTETGLRNGYLLERF